MGRVRRVVVAAMLLGALGVPMTSNPASAAGPLDVAIVDMGIAIPPVLFGSPSTRVAALADYDNQLVLTVSADRRQVHVRDPGVLFVAVPPCIGGLGAATCIVLDANIRVNDIGVVTGLGNDRVDVIAPPTVRDHIGGGPGNDRLSGGEGPSQVEGDDGNDVLLGNGGDDALRGFGQADDYFGGPGIDTANLTYNQGAVSVSMDETANDGSLGEGDNVHDDIEFAGPSADGYGGNALVDVPGGDVYVGNEGPNGLGGQNSPTVAHGFGGDDTLGLRGLTAEVSLLDGGEGNDFILVSGSPATVLGGPGDDRIFVGRNGPVDDVDCGDGTDRVQADVGDAIAANCEIVTFV